MESHGSLHPLLTDGQIRRQHEAPANLQRIQCPLGRWRRVSACARRAEAARTLGVPRTDSERQGSRRAVAPLHSMHVGRGLNQPRRTFGVAGVRGGHQWGETVGVPSIDRRTAVE